ncbi:hypothetical protein OVN18_04320 [Microcella daejeonensis]|uniref:Uncharacterized protein n=1 Tax=Microcella daejeonensis TaxID=2994971 RepID=A0A9E8MMJ0_9MICO|nr:hypothetical protein [Microcella daejeonensis]WAB82241.1 hypothetical protein OVN18_04320 [Microcella daejeonensis]
MTTKGKHFTHPGYPIVLGSISIVLGLLSIAVPYRDEPSTRGLPALLGIPVWGVGAFCIVMGVLFVAIGIRQAVLSRR